MFISPPYIKCPKCGKMSFGILMICDNHYCRRCKECYFPDGHERGWATPLPELNKKIIYIDQFAISNMMIALDSKSKSNGKSPHHNFWIELFERLHSLCKLMYAGLARKFATGGRKKPMSEGMVNDIDIISTLMPYCNAMFIDNECRGLLTEHPISDEINYGASVFSLNNKEGFLAYWDEIERNAHEEHISKVREVYGDDWKNPYLTLYQKS